ncbi:dipicolinate synthase subunit DpsA [Oscillospiraceae bacterium OttesenSCG-928-F05]|nr:dipicolinate synthase subunit DpsA [Oscillospiraceae bacterium OttesenSCG-928-F05]
MKEQLKFILAGGDMRQVHLAAFLAADGHHVTVAAIDDLPPAEGVNVYEGLPRLRDADCVLLPLPVTGEDGQIHTPLSKTSVSPDAVFSALRPGQTVIAGKIPPELFEKAALRGVRLYDYLEREELAVLNAVPTVEGAIQIACEETAATLWRSKVLVIGYGRIGKLLARLLRAFGAEVTVSARKPADFAWIKAEGYESVHTGALEGSLRDFDVVFNTVPHMVLTTRRLSELKRGALVIDLASKPGGVDFAAAQTLGVNTVWALSLPGKVAPLTAAGIIRDTIYHILNEQEEGSDGEN